MRPATPPRDGVVDAHDRVGALTAADVEPTVEEPTPEAEPEPAAPLPPPEPAFDFAALDASPGVDPIPSEPDMLPSDDVRGGPEPIAPTALSASAIGQRLRRRPDSPSVVPEHARESPPTPPVPATVATSGTARAALREIDAPPPPLVIELPSGTTLFVRLEYTIAADGHVTDARVTESSGDTRLDESTRAFVLARWRYVPPGAARTVTRRFVFTSAN